MKNENCNSCDHSGLISFHQNMMNVNLSYTTILFYCFGCKHGPISNMESKQLLIDSRQKIIYSCTDEILKQLNKKMTI